MRAATARRAVALFAIALITVQLSACTPRAAAPTRLLPGFEAQLATIEAVELRGAGDTVLATLERHADGWHVRERGGWPADHTAMQALLADLAGANRKEAKTDRPDRYARIGVEPVADAEVQTDAEIAAAIESGAGAANLGGLQVTARGKGWSQALIVGTAPNAGGGRFVRVAAEPQAWLVDRNFEIPRTPAAWLDTRLLAVPLAHVVRVDSRDAAGHEFAVEHRDDRFRVVGLPSAAMGDSYRGDELAGVIEDLHLEDVAADDGAAAERTVRFERHEGPALAIDAWRVNGRVWVRVRECTGETCVARGAFAGRRFLLPAHLAARLLLTRDQVLGHGP